MNTKTLPETSKSELAALHDQLASLRSKFEINPPGTVLYSAFLSSLDDEILLVVADGFGGASMSVVEGNYPFDYFTQTEEFFDTESAAVAAAGVYLEKHG